MIYSDRANGEKNNRANSSREAYAAISTVYPRHTGVSRRWILFSVRVRGGLFAISFFINFFTITILQLRFWVRRRPGGSALPLISRQKSNFLHSRERYKLLAISGAATHSDMFHSFGA